jgi:hypothetical protein
MIKAHKSGDKGHRTLKIDIFDNDIFRYLIGDDRQNRDNGC